MELDSISSFLPYQLCNKLPFLSLIYILGESQYERAQVKIQCDKSIKPLVLCLAYYSKCSNLIDIFSMMIFVCILIPPLSSLSGCRRDQGVSGDQVSIMVDGVQVALPSYEEAVYGSSGHCVPPADPRVQIVLSEESGPSGRNGPREQQQQDQGACSSAGGAEEAPGQSGLSEAWGSRSSETVMVHQATTSSWVAGSGHSQLAHKEAPDSENSDIQSLLSLTSEDYTDGRWSVLIINY